MNCNWSKEEKEKLIKLYNLGWSYLKIAQALNRTISSVSNQAHKMRLKPRNAFGKNYKKITEQEEKEIINLFYQGNSIPDIMKKVERSRSSIINVLKKQGLWGVRYKKYIQPQINVGDKVTCKVTFNNLETVSKTGIVIALYPHVFLVDFGSFRECFEYTQVYVGEIKILGDRLKEVS